MYLQKNIYTCLLYVFLEVSTFPGFGDPGTYLNEPQQKPSIFGFKNRNKNTQKWSFPMWQPLDRKSM